MLRNALFLSNFLFQISSLLLTYENNTRCLRPTILINQKLWDLEKLTAAIYL